MKHNEIKAEEKLFTADELMPTDHKTMMNAISDLSEKYPFISLSFIGTSILGRSIPMITVGNEDAPSALYVAAHHGMEWICTAVLLKFTEELCALVEGGGKIFNISPRALFKTRSLRIVPMLNPDGVELQIHGPKESDVLYNRLIAMNKGRDFSKWQANARGVDLNHNYDAGFEEYKRLEKDAGILSGCATRYSGEFAESEPETGALCSHIRWNGAIKGALSLHTQGEEIYCGGADVSNRCKTIGNLLERMTGYKLCLPEKMASYGGMTDWLVSKMNIPSFTLECGKGVNPLPAEDFFGIYAKLREALFTFPILI